MKKNAFNEVDASCSVSKQQKLLTAHIRFYERFQKALGDGKNLDEILQLPLREELANLKNFPEDTFDEKLEAFYKNLDTLLS